MVYRKFLAKRKVLAENIRRHLEAAKLQQNEFAEMIGISPQHFSFYVTGKREPREETLNRIAAGFNIDPLELYRIPPGMVDPSFEKAWNCLIELKTNDEGLNIVRDFLMLLVKNDLNETSKETLAVIKHLIKTIPK